MLTAFLGFRFVWFPSSSNLSLSLPSAMFGEMAADSSMGMGMSFHQGVATSTTLYHHYHHHMLSFQSNPDSSPTAAAIISPTTITTPAVGPAPAPAPAHGLGPNIAGIFLPSPNTPMLANVASSSSSLHGVPPTPKCKFVTGSPADWTTHELAVLKEGLTRYAHEPNIMKYIKIAAMLPTRTIRDVALRCWWTTGKESRRRKPDEFYAGKKIRDKEKMVASTSVANFQMAPLNNVAPFSISMHHAGQNSLVPKEDNAAQHLLEENNQLLSEIAANIETSKMEENMDLFLRTNNNIRTISKRMRETPGIMGQMPPLPVPVNEDHLNLLLQLDSGTVLEGVYTAEIRLDCRT